MDNNNNKKRITNKALLDMMHVLKNDCVMNERELNTLATKIVSKMMRLRTMEDWFDHVRATEIATNDDYNNLEMTEEENCLGEMAKLMTLLSLFQDSEQFEKCAIIKRRLDVIKDILNKYK